MSQALKHRNNIKPDGQHTNTQCRGSGHEADENLTGHVEPGRNGRKKPRILGNDRTYIYIYIWKLTLSILYQELFPVSSSVACWSSFCTVRFAHTKVIVLVVFCVHPFEMVVGLV